MPSTTKWSNLHYYYNQRNYFGFLISFQLHKHLLNAVSIVVDLL